MKESMLPPEDRALGRLLHECKPRGELPPGFQNSVWRRIEREGLTEETASPSWLEKTVSWILRPRFALTSAAALLIIGASIGVLDGVSFSRQSAQMRYVASVSPQSVSQ